MTVVAGAARCATSLAILLVAICTAALADAPVLHILGIRLGMSQEEVAQALSARDDVAERDEVRRSSGALSRMVVRLRDGRTLQIAFAPPAAPMSADIVLSDPAATDVAAARRDAEVQYGAPAGTRRTDGGRGLILGWNGTPGAEGAMRPRPGAAGTLRLQVLPDRGSELRLTRVP